MINQINLPTVDIEFVPSAVIPFGTTFWRVLDVDLAADKVLVISEHSVAQRAYHKKWVSFIWEKSDIRAWLNGEYLSSAFSNEERAAILKSVIQNPDNPEYRTKGGNSTTDKIFLLSIEEAQCYFKSDKNRALGEWWWLRSPGFFGDYAARVRYDGSLDVRGDDVGRVYGIRPAFYINLESEIFKSFIIDKTSKSITIRVPQAAVKDNVIREVARGIETAIIPEGTTAIGDGAFRDCKKLVSVVFPKSLKKVGKEAFKGCNNLQYTSAMFMVPGKICDSFAKHMGVCDATALAWVCMYQKGELWEKALAKQLTAENAPSVLAAMTAHIREAKSPKKAVTAAAAFVHANVGLLPGEGIKELLDALREKKQGAVADELATDPAVAFAYASKETSNVEGRVLEDGTILYGNTEVPLDIGVRFFFGKLFLRILSLDIDKHTALVISEDCVTEKTYHNNRGSITWEGSDTRAWLNGKYLSSAFSDEERAAILKSVIQNPDNPEYRTKGGNSTTDRIFLLSIEEAQSYFKSDKDRALGEWWWLRSPGYYGGYAAYVGDDGSLNTYGLHICNESNIRPAFHVDLKSVFFKSIISINQKGETLIKSPVLRIKAGEVLESYADTAKVILPSYAKKIGAGAFQNYLNLTTITWSGKAPEIDKEAFCNCPNLRLPAELYTSKKLPDESFAAYLPDDPDVIARAMLQKVGSKYRETAIKRLTEGNVFAVADALLSHMAEWKDPELMLQFAFAAAPLLSAKQLERFRIMIPWYDGWKDLLMREAESTGQKYAPIFFEISMSPRLPKIEGLSELPALREILPAVYPYACAYGYGRVDPKDYKKAVSAYVKLAEAEKVAAKFGHYTLMSFLKTWIREDGPRWYAPYAAYANDAELTSLIADLKAWEKEKDKKEQIIRVRGAILLNDTVTAMRYADSLGLLERYAQMRGEDADTIRDNIISDFGLNESGRGSWTFGDRTVTATLNSDLTFTLKDADGKTLKSLPKNGASYISYAEYELAQKEFDALKKDVKSTAKTRNDKIFADFLSGRERPAKEWKNAYMNNPVLRTLARLIVWQQGDKTFTLAGNSLRLADGTSYTLTDDPVKVAHPMEMTKEDVEAWQHYFNENDLKQPFEQVWEPVADASFVKPGRYDGCTVPLYTLMNKEKHGIIMEGRSRITLKDCKADLIQLEGHHDWYNNEFEVRNFSFEKYTRQVNHIVVHFDKATVAGRVKKDDASAAQWFDRFTLAQIQGFIEIANENKAVNVLALLLEYKNNHFADFDPMEQFTLDW